MKINKTIIGILTAAAAAVTTITVLTTGNEPMISDTPTTGKVHYYSTSGSDGTGTRDEPYKWSATKVNASLSLGYSVLLKRGETFLGSVIIGKSGTAASRITIGAWGEGEAPLLTGFVPVNSWTYLGNGVYESEAIATVPASLNLVTVNDSVMGMGRYPNADAPNGGYLTISTFSGKTSVTLPDLPAIPNWTGATCDIRGERWQINTSTISQHDGANHIIYYTGIVEPKKNFGVFISNSPKTLDKNGEWYYNPNTRKLTMYWNNGQPPNVKISTKENGITSLGKSYISVKDIAIEGFNNNSINFTGGSTKDSLVNVQIKNSGYTGVFVQSSTSFAIEKCEVNHSLNSGIDLYIGTDFASVRNTKVLNTYMIAGMGGSGDHKGIAVNLRGKGSLAEYNELKNCGFTAFYMGPVDDIVIQNNSVNGYGIVKDDCAAFYTYTGNIKLNLKGRIIKNNIVRNGIGANYGTSGVGLFSISAYGFYGDLNASDILIDSNYFENAGRATLFFHFAHNITFTNNTGVNTQFMIYVVRDATRDNYGNIINNNIFYTTGNGYNAKFDNYANSTVSTLGTMDNNYFINPPTKATPWSIRNNNYNFSQWKNSTGWDRNSTQKILSASDVIKTVYATDSPIVISLGGYKWKNIKGELFENPLRPYTGAVLIRDGKDTVITIPDVDSSTITITSNATTYNAGASITLTAVTNKPNNEISNIEFLVNGSHLRTDITPNPWSARWDNVKAKTYSFSAKLTGKDGKVTTSENLIITVK